MIESWHNLSVLDYWQYKTLVCVFYISKDAWDR